MKPKWERIEHDDIKVGDVIQIHQRHLEDKLSIRTEGGVTGINGIARGVTLSGKRICMTESTSNIAVTIKRKVKKPKPGSLWWHEGTRTGWVKTRIRDHPDYIYAQFVGALTRHAGELLTYVQIDAQLAAELVQYANQDRKKGKRDRPESG